MDNNKIEESSVHILESVLRKHCLLLSDIKKGDKGMGWDGAIKLYTSAKHSIDTWEADVPVQVKGHIDKKNKYLSKEKIKYTVKVSHLRAYFRAHGVIYFQIFMSEDLEIDAIFYNLLLPVKLKSYLESVKFREKKRSTGEIKTISIPFQRLNKIPKELYVLCKQFTQDSNKQASGIGPLVGNTVSRGELNSVEEIKVTALGINNEFDLLKKLSRGDVSFYVKKKGESIELPLEFIENAKYTIGKEINKSVVVDKVQYYASYKVIGDSDDSYKIILSKNLELDFKDYKLNFKPKSSLSSIGYDAKLMLAIYNYKKFAIAGQEINYYNMVIPPDMLEKLYLYIDYAKILDMLDIEFKTPIDKISQKDMQTFGHLVSFLRGDRNKELGKFGGDYCCELNKKYIPLYISINDEGDVTIEFKIYSPYRRVCIIDEDKDKKYIVPDFSQLNKEDLANLYQYKYDKLYKQIDNCDINEFTANYLTTTCLLLISTYDINKEIGLLNLADYILDKLVIVSKNETHYIINRLQIKKRKNLLSSADILALKELLKKETETEILCAVNILLGNIEEASKGLSRIEPETKVAFENFPIYTLYKQKL